MAYRGASEDHRLDRMLRACDPIGGRMPSDPRLVAAFHSMSALIVSEPRRTGHRWRFAKRPRAALVGIAAVLLTTGVAVAATNLFRPTHTHRYPPKGMITGGGPGELLNVDGTDFRQVALQVSSDIPYPPGYESWRESVISSEYQEQQDACLHGPVYACRAKVPTGALHGTFAASAFCAWVLEWRQDVMTGRPAAAARDARVLSGALQWKAVTAWDAHPSLSVPGDMGTTHPSTFGWMIPFIQAIGADDPARVDRAIVNDANYGGQFALWTDTGLGLSLRLNLVGRPLLTYLHRHGL